MKQATFLKLEEKITFASITHPGSFSTYYVVIIIYLCSYFTNKKHVDFYRNFMSLL